MKPVWRWSLVYLGFLAANVIYGYYQQTPRQRLTELTATNQELKERVLELEVNLTRLLAEEEQ